MRANTEFKFKTFDGTELFARSWAPTTQTSGPAKALIVLHRGHEHSGRLQEIVDELALPDFWAFAYDGRGHGKSPGPRGYAEDYSFLVKDLETFVNQVCKNHGIAIENISVVANSVGAVVASNWVHDYAPRIRSLVLAAPALRVKLYVPLALTGLRILNVFKKPAFISSYVKSKMLTHDADEARKYNEDPLITRDIAVNILLGLYDAGTRLLDDAAAIVAPTLILSAGKDFVVKLSSQEQFFAGLGSSVKEMHVFKDFYHGVFYEKGRAEAFAKARAFILKSFETSVNRSDLLKADTSGPSARKLAALDNLSFFKNVNFAIQRLFLSTLGRLSEGVRLGWKTGFDSGVSLNYVYKNQASGTTPLGKVIDRGYLEAIGWKGCRIRKVNLENLVEEAIQKQKARGEGVRILDVAGGPAKYLVDIAKRYQGNDLTIAVRDNTEIGLEEGRKLAEEAKVKNVHYTRVDAFADSAKPIPEFNGKGPNIIVISGFFELFSNNEQISKVISAVAEIADENAYLIYTGQPWHPQQEMIAKVLINRDGNPWFMRLRSQAELDELFRAQGFEKNRMEIDHFGIFTVSLAEFKAPLTRLKSVKSAPAQATISNPV